jgi:hypothetical protein
MNKFLLPSFFSFFLFSYSIAQNFKGQWKGTFVDNSSSAYGVGSNTCDYILELDVSGSKVSGSSYTYFSEGGKKYYTICSVEGSIDEKKKYIEVRETARTKTNIPEHISNCLQIHKLSYTLEGQTETIEGKWVPVPNQNGDCGYGLTSLTRRVLVSAFPDVAKKSEKKKQEKITPSAKNTTTASVHVSHKIKSKKDKNNLREVETKSTNSKTDEAKLTTQNNISPSPVSINENPQEPNQKEELSDFDKYEKRQNTIIETFVINSNKISIELYDNGEIDGDNISLFFNKKLIFSNKKLSEKSIKADLELTNSSDPNELVMFAENLGSIPPNTALMIIYDGDKRYELRITSDLEKNGMIQFVRKNRSHNN